MAVSHKGAISFGLVHIPVALHTATQDNDVRFNQLCKSDHSRVRYKKVCSGCGKEAAEDEIVKGFAYEKDQYVVVTDEEFERIKTEKDRSLQIIHFTDLSSIDPVYYEKSYHVVPEAGGEKAFALLWRAMREENKVAVAKTVMGVSETLLAIMPTDTGLLIEKMYYKDEIKVLPREYVGAVVSDAELAVVVQLIGALDRPFQPELYHDEYQARLRALIQDKIAGREIVAPAEEKPGNIIDLMSALQQSVKEADKARRTG